MGSNPILPAMAYRKEPVSICDRCGREERDLTIANTDWTTLHVVPRHAVGQRAYKTNNNLRHDLCPECMSAYSEFMESGGMAGAMVTV